MLHKESTDVVLKAAGITAKHVICVCVKLRTRRPLCDESIDAFTLQAESPNHLEFQYRRHLIFGLNGRKLVVDVAKSTSSFYS
jgi:hypothetical protein